MGGTFNPIHLGHLLAAQEALVHADLDEILFLPNRIPPHRSSKEALPPALERYLMVCLATASHPRFRVSALELEREGPSYTIDTVEELLRRDPSRALTFITGADALLLSRWYRLDELLGRLERFLVVTRPGFDLDRLGQHLDRMELGHRDRIQTLDIPGMEISSTALRRRIRAGRPIRYLVPEPVADYIQKTGLYLTDPAPIRPEEPDPQAEAGNHGGGIQ